jgi:hypothetical protein
MSTILVSDTSILMDLERGGFLDCCFRLPFTFAVPDLLYRRELAAGGGPELVARGLRDAYARARRRSALDAINGWWRVAGVGSSLSGCSSLACCGFSINVSRARSLKTVLLVQGLELIATHPRCRLPRAEIDIRLVRHRGV